MEFKFNEAFKEANATRKRYRVMLGSAGSGKSVDIAQDYILKLTSTRNKGCSLMVVRKSEGSNYNSTYAELCAAISKVSFRRRGDTEQHSLWDLWEATKIPLGLKCTLNGNQIIFRGCNDARAIERIKSVTVPNGKICWIWVEEATEITQSDFEILDDRLRGFLTNSNLYYQITLSFNPINAQHWIKRTLWDIDNEDIFKCKTTYLQNAFIDEEYKRRMDRRRRVDPEGYEVYGLGNWGNVGDSILNNYTFCNVNQDVNFYDSITIGHDFGFNHADAMLKVGFKDGDMYVIKENYEHDSFTAEIIKHVENKGFKDNIMYCDSAEPDRIKEWRTAGFRAVPVSKDKNSVRGQIDYLKQRKIYIDYSCTNTIKEIQQWRWKKDSNGLLLDEPLEVEDDAMAALRYCIEPYRRDRRIKTLSKNTLGL